MNSTPPTSVTEARPFPLVLFALAMAAQLLLALGLFALVAPGALRAEIAQPGAILLGTILLGLPLSLFEYLYHRYLLHSAVLPFLGSMHRAHGIHHGLTAVKAPVRPSEPERMVPVRSEFPVEHEHQEDSMMFPLWALAIFLGVFAILMALPIKLLFPGSPAFVATMFAVVLYYSAYELWHAALHLPFERYWKPWMENRRFGRAVRYAYGFHLMHHWRPTANLAVVGFWGFALWDHLFRTHRRPANMPLDGAQVSYVDAEMRKPRWPVALLDRWQAGLYRASRRVEGFAARVFLRRRGGNTG
jgi:hypothetical protein